MASHGSFELFNLTSKFDMETKLDNTTKPQHDAKLPVSSSFSDGYSDEWKLKTQAVRLRLMINSGFGKTNKPLSPKRLEELKRNLAEIEEALNGC